MAVITEVLPFHHPRGWNEHVLHSCLVYMGDQAALLD